jgi:hypothetical protein
MLCGNFFLHVNSKILILFFEGLSKLEVYLKKLLLIIAFLSAVMEVDSLVQGGLNFWSNYSYSTLFEGTGLYYY